MISLNDGRTELFQWDTARKLTVDAECSQAHFSNKVYGNSIDVDIIDGVADIPDILLQSDHDLHVWAYAGTPEDGYTKIAKTFKVNRRNKPAGYIYTPPEKPAATSVSWNDLEDKPFYDTREIIPGVNIEWDGDTTGRVTDDKGLYYKVSDLTFTDEEVKEMTITTTDGTFELKDAKFWPMDVGDGCYFESYRLSIVRTENSINGASESTFPETGVYFGANIRALTSKDTISENGELKQIDEKFIPEIDIYEEEEILFSGDANFTDFIPAISPSYAEIQLAPYDLEAGDSITIGYSSWSYTGTLSTSGTGLSMPYFYYEPETGVASVRGEYEEFTTLVTIKRTKAVTPRLKFATMPKSEIVRMVLATLKSAEEV